MNVVNQNNPLSCPVPAVTRRIMGCLDLFNLGFYTEAFVSCFALLDDLVQSVVEAGLQKKGLGEDKTEGLLRAIEKERMNRYLCTLLPLCGMDGLDTANADLYGRLVKRPKSSTNYVRNEVMHNNLRLNRQLAFDHLVTILDAINWLRSNPFGYNIPHFPKFSVAASEFTIFDKDGVQVYPAPPPPPPSNPHA